MTARRYTLAGLVVLLAAIIIPPLVIPLTVHEWLHVLTPAVVLLSLPGAVLFPLLYSRVPWYASHLGRALMMSAVGISGVLILASVRIWAEFPHIERTYLGDPLATDLIRVLVFSWLTTAIHYQLGVLWVMYRRGSDIHTDDVEHRQSDSPSPST